MDASSRWGTGTRRHRVSSLLQARSGKRTAHSISYGPRRDDESSLADAASIREANVGNLFFSTIFCQRLCMVCMYGMLVRYVSSLGKVK